MKSVMGWGGMLVVLLAAIILGELPLMKDFNRFIQQREFWFMVATGGMAVIGFVLLMGGILDLLIAQDRTLSHEGAEDVERGTRMAARPVAWRTAFYRVWGSATGREGSEQFTFREMKQAWQSGAWRRETIWRRRYITALGALLLTIGIFGVAFTLGPPPIKAIVGGALLYAAVMLMRGFSKA